MTPAAALNVLLERYPLCFFGLESKRRPIKIGIFEDLLAVGILPPAKLSLALQFYSRNVGYLRASKAGAPRIDLEGNVTGEVSDKEAAHAQQHLGVILERKAAKAKAKRDAARKAPVDLPPAAAVVPAAPVAVPVAPAAVVPPAAPVRIVVTAPSAPGRRPVLRLKRA